MKLRISANSVRLRLRRSEVDQLAETGAVEESIAFGPLENDRLTYLIRMLPGVRAIEVVFAGGQLIIDVPAEIAKEWARTETVGMDGKVPIGNGEFLDVLIEKDFPCKHSDGREDPTDLFAELSNSAEC
jgi:hypothetical protein